MKRRPKLRTILGWIFATAYSLTVLRYTVAFFETFAGPGSNRRFLGFSLHHMQDVALLPFLGALEVASVILACMYWRSRGATRTRFLCLFLLCQAYPVASFYLDGQRSDYVANQQEAERLAREHETQITRAQQADSADYGRLREQTDALERRRRDLAEDLNARSAELDRKRATLKTALETIRGLSSMLTNSDEVRGRELVGEIKVWEDDVRSLRAEIQTDTEEVRRILGQRSEVDEAIARATKRIDAWRREAMALSSRSTGDKPETLLGYLVSQMASAKSLVLAFLSLLFPVIILGVTAALVSDEATGEPTLKQQLDVLASLKPEFQKSCAAMLGVAITSHLQTIRASKTVADRTVAFGLEAQGAVELVEAGASIKTQIDQHNRLSRAAKQALLRAVQDFESRTFEERRKAP